MRKYYILSAKIWNNGIFTPCWFKPLNRKKAQKLLIGNIFDKDKFPITKIKMVELKGDK